MGALKDLKSNIWKYYLHQVFSGAMFFTPILVLFWQENGLSMTQLMILQSLYCVAVILLEVPTGYFADLFGRRKSLIYSGFFMALGMLVYSLGYNFFQFLIAEIIWAVGISLMSGADSAMVYDTLKDLKREKLYKKIWGNAIFYNLLAVSLSSIIGAFIGKISLRYVFVAMVPFMLMMIPVALSMKEPKRHKRIIKKNYMHELFSILYYSLFKNVKLRWILVYSGIIIGFNHAAWLLYQPYFKLSGLDLIYFGFVFALVHLTAAFSSKKAHFVEEKIGKRNSLILLVVFVGISYILMSKIIFVFSFVFVFLQQFVRGFSRVVLSDYVNELTTSDIRATILSAKSLIDRLVYAIIIPFVGWIADVYTLIHALIALGITSLIVGAVILLVLYKTRNLE